MINKLLLLIFLLASFIYPKNIFANEYFYVDLNRKYILDLEGNALITDEFSIENITTEKSLPSFIYNINNIRAEYFIVKRGAEEIAYSIEKNDAHITRFNTKAKAIPIIANRVAVFIRMRVPS